MCRVIVAGGRNVAESEHNIRAVAIELLRLKATVVLSGTQHGGDACGEMAAARLCLTVRPFPPDYKRYSGKQAPAIRNSAMAKEADAVIFFPGGKGTADMREKAERAGLHIVELRTAEMIAPAKTKAKRDEFGNAFAPELPL